MEERPVKSRKSRAPRAPRGAGVPKKPRVPRATRAALKARDRARAAVQSAQRALLAAEARVPAELIDTAALLHAAGLDPEPPDSVGAPPWATNMPPRPDPMVDTMLAVGARVTAVLNQREEAAAGARTLSLLLERVGVLATAYRDVNVGDDADAALHLRGKLLEALAEAVADQGAAFRGLNPAAPPAGEVAP